MTRPHAITVSYALAAIVAGAAIFFASLARAFGTSELPAPFFWLDVALVYLLAALPLAASLAAALFAAPGAWRNRIAIFMLQCAILLIVPRLYIAARTNSDISRAMDLVDQSRYLEAGQLVHRIQKLAPSATWHGKPLNAIAASLDEMVARLESAVVHPLAAEATAVQRIERAQHLAMLGRTQQALSNIDSAPALQSAEACNLRGTVFETRREWSDARDWYAKSKTVLQSSVPSPQPAGALARAVRGIAFCERKLGRVREAEAAWLELLALVPTADSHFLLAQFYEDTQQTAKSELHARKAMSLAPERYKSPGNKLLNNLVTSHFSCLSVFHTPEPLTR